MSTATPQPVGPGAYEVVPTPKQATTKVPIVVVSCTFFYANYFQAKQRRASQLLRPGSFNNADESESDFFNSAQAASQVIQLDCI